MPAFILFLLLSFIALPIGAEEAVITLKDLEQEALKNNPEIGMAGEKAAAAERRKSLAAAMPDPMIGYEIRNIGGWGTSTVGAEEMSMKGWVFTQEIPFPGKLSTKGNAAGKQAEREYDNALAMRLRVLNTLRSAYYDYYLAYRSAEILEQNKETMKNFQRIAETRYATGQGIQQDVLRSQLEVSMLLEKLAMQEQKKETQRAMINSLLGRDPRSPLGRPGDRLRTGFEGSLDAVADKALAHSPALGARQRMVEQSQYEMSMSKQEYLPDFTVSAGKFSRGEMDNVYEASVMLKVPLYFWNKTKGVKAASADLASARYDYQAAKLMTISRVKDLFTMAKTSERLLNLYEAGILPQARLALQSATSNYQVGKIDFLSLLESQSLLFRYQVQYEEELVNLNKTISLISEVTGEEGEPINAK